MKILFIVPYVPNPVRVRPYELIRTLARRGHDVTLATLWSSAQEQADVQKLLAMGIKVWSYSLPRHRSLLNCALALPSHVPLQSVFCWQPAFAHTLAQRIQENHFDLVHIEHLRGARYGITIQQALAKQGSSIPIVWDSVDCISHLFEQASKNSRSLSGRLMTLIDLQRTRRYEGWLVHQFDRVLTTSQTDRQALAALATNPSLQKTARSSAPASTLSSDKIAVVPNGVDTEHFSPNDLPRKPATLTFTGKMSYHANVTAALHLVNDIMPRVWARRADVEVEIVGKDPTAQISALDSRSNRRQSGRVIVTGTVPEMRTYLRKATVAVAPVPYGAGIQNKVLEAMACGVPVIASKQAASGLLAQPEQHLMVAEDTETFAQSVINLLADPQRQRMMGLAGRAYTEQYHSWDAIVAQLERVYADAAEDRK